MEFPDASGLRPTGDRIKQTLFNWLGQSLSGKHCLDAYAGSGALGFEAASRGAERVVLCETDLNALKFLNRNAASLDARQCEIIAGDVTTWLGRGGGNFDVVFCDPPFAKVAHAAFLDAVAARLNSDALVYVESDSPLDGLAGPTLPYEIAKQSKAGAVYFGLLRLIPTR